MAIRKPGSWTVASECFLPGAPIFYPFGGTLSRLTRALETSDEIVRHQISELGSAKIPTYIRTCGSSKERQHSFRSQYIESHHHSARAASLLTASRPQHTAQTPKEDPRASRSPRTRSSSAYTSRIHGHTTHDHSFLSVWPTNLEVQHHPPPVREGWTRSGGDRSVGGGLLSSTRSEVGTKPRGTRVGDVIKGAFRGAI